MILKSFSLLALMIVGFFSLSAPAKAQYSGCPTVERQGAVQMEPTDGGENYDFTQPVSNLFFLANRSGSAHARNTVVRGLTISRFFYKMRTHIAYVKLSDGSVCAAPDVVNIQIGFEPFQVYVQREYPEGTCQHNAILEHEQNHVKIYREALAQRYQYIESAIQASVSSMDYPIRTVDIQEARRVIEERVKTSMNQEIVEITQEQARRNALLDGPESMRMTFSMCQNW